MRVANAPCSWGVLEFDLPGQPIAYSQVLDEMRETGYAGTELGDWGFLPTHPRRLRRELERRGLELVGAFVPVALSDPGSHPAGEGTAVRTAQLLAAAGAQRAFIVLSDENKDQGRSAMAGRIQAEHGLSGAQWTVFAEGVDRIAERVRQETGLRTVFHHHCGGFVETPAEVGRLLSLTDPLTVGLCLDTGHYRFGGGDPLAALRQWADRIWHLHFKDCHPAIAARSRDEGWSYLESVRRGIFCELGQGEVEFPVLVDELRGWRYEGWIVVEQDVLPGMGAPRASAQRNRDYLRGLGL